MISQHVSDVLASYHSISVPVDVLESSLQREMRALCNSLSEALTSLLCVDQHSEEVPNLVARVNVEVLARRDVVSAREELWPANDELSVLFRDRSHGLAELTECKPAVSVEVVSFKEEHGIISGNQVKLEVSAKIVN